MKALICFLISLTLSASLIAQEVEKNEVDRITGVHLKKTSLTEFGKVTEHSIGYMYLIKASKSNTNLYSLGLIFQEIDVFGIAKGQIITLVLKNSKKIVLKCNNGNIAFKEGLYWKAEAQYELSTKQIQDLKTSSIDFARVEITYSGKRFNRDFVDFPDPEIIQKHLKSLSL